MTSNTALQPLTAAVQPIQAFDSSDVIVVRTSNGLLTAVVLTFCTFWSLPTGVDILGVLGLVESLVVRVSPTSITAFTGGPSVSLALSFI
jgi:hypothetical protein